MFILIDYSQVIDGILFLKVITTLKFSIFLITFIDISGNGKFNYLLECIE